MRVVSALHENPYYSHVFNGLYVFDEIQPNRIAFSTKLFINLYEAFKKPWSSTFFGRCGSAHSRRTIGGKSKTNCSLLAADTNAVCVRARVRFCGFNRINHFSSINKSMHGTYDQFHVIYVDCGCAAAERNCYLFTRYLDLSSFFCANQMRRIPTMYNCTHTNTRTQPITIGSESNPIVNSAKYTAKSILASIEVYN